MKDITIKIRTFSDLAYGNFMRLDCVENNLYAGIKLKAGQKLPSAEILGKRILSLIKLNESDKIKIPLPKVKP